MLNLPGFIRRLDKNDLIYIIINRNIEKPLNYIYQYNPIWKYEIPYNKEL